MTVLSIRKTAGA